VRNGSAAEEAECTKVAVVVDDDDDITVNDGDDDDVDAAAEVLGTNMGAPVLMLPLLAVKEAVAATVVEEGGKSSRDRLMEITAGGVEETERVEPIAPPEDEREEKPNGSP